MKLTIKIVTFFLFLATLTCSAQKIKVKKGKVLVDKVAISSFEEEGEDYVFTDLKDNSKLFKVDLQSIRRDKEIIKKWLVVTNSDKSKSTEVEMEYLSMTFSNKKAVAELFFTKYKILTLTGIDIDKLNSFLDEKRPSQSEVASSILKGDLQKKVELNNLNINIDHKNNFIFKGPIPYGNSFASEKRKKSANMENLIGHYTLSNTTSPFDPGVVSFYDLDNHKVAVVTVGGFKTNVKLPYEKKEFKFTSSEKYRNHQSSPFITEIIQQLFLNEIVLGHQLNNKREGIYQTKVEQRKESVEKFKKESNNIYYTKGYIVDEKKGKREGEIQFVVEKQKTNSGIIDLDEATLGQRVSLKYKNKKGKTRFETFKSKDEEKFCVYNDSTERCFKGMRAKGKGVELVARGLSSLSFDTSYYYEIIKESENIGIYKDVTFDSGYLVKLANQKKALQFNTKNKQKNIENFNKYFNGSINPEDVSNFDFSKKEDVLKLIELYKN